MRLRSTYHRGFVDGFGQGWWELAQAATYSVTRARAQTTAGQLWLDDLAGHIGQLTGNPVPRDAHLLRTRLDQIRAVTAGLLPQHARRAAYRYGFVDGRVAAFAVVVRDLYLAAGQDLGSLRPAIDGRPAHRWLETTRRWWLGLAAHGPTPLPGTPAALAWSTLTGGAAPTHAPAPPATPPGRAAHTAARAAPAATQPGQAATTPAPVCGIARVDHRPAARR